MLYKKLKSGKAVVQNGFTELSLVVALWKKHPAVPETGFITMHEQMRFSISHIELKKLQPTPLLSTRVMLGTT
jgi:hypothetical protein